MYRVLGLEFGGLGLGLGPRFRVYKGLGFRVPGFFSHLRPPTPSPAQYLKLLNPKPLNPKP